MTDTIILMPDEQFAAMISRAMDEMPERYIRGLDNVVVTYEDEPTPDQRVKLKLRGDQTLFGLYEGIPLTKRGAGYNLVLPDKITIFKFPILYTSHDEASVYRQVKHTLWHEIAHFYGLDHDKIHEIESRWQ
jgi:predicted Zn-dependent protease with MMP-like domain